MYFIELVTSQHKLGITTLCIKNLPPERNRSNLFLIYLTPLHILCTASTRHLPSVSLTSNVCRNWATLFSYPISQRFCLALSPPPLPPSALPFYPLWLPKADAVISQAFNSLSHPLAATFFKSCLPLPRWMHSMQFLIPAGRCSWWCQTWKTAEKRYQEPTEGSEWLKELEGTSGRLRGAAPIWLLFFFTLCFQSWLYRFLSPETLPQ